MAQQTDNYITTEKKARWGFTGDADGIISVGTGNKDDGEKSIDAGPSDHAGSHNNGGGENPLADKTVPQLKAYAAEKGYDLGDATKKDDIIAAIQLAEGN